HVATIKGDTEIVALIDEIVVAQPEKLLARSALDDTLHETIWSHPGPSEELTEADAVAVEERWQAHLAESGAGPLRLVSSVEQLRHSLISFVRAVTVRSGLAERSVSQPDNWVFESETERFAPSKWCAFRGMTPVRYEALLAVQKTRGSVRGFDGHRTKRHLEKLFSRAFTSDATLSDVLQKWLKTSYGKGSSSSACPAIALSATRASSSSSRFTNHIRTRSSLKASVRSWTMKTMRRARLFVTSANLACSAGSAQMPRVGQQAERRPTSISTRQRSGRCRWATRSVRRSRTSTISASRTTVCSSVMDED